VTTLREGAEYFKHVDEVVAQRPALEGKKLQMHGYVIPLENEQAEHTRVAVQSAEQPIRSGEPGNVMSVSYTGVVPDTFKDEAEVVLRASLPGTASTRIRTASSRSAVEVRGSQ